MLKLLKRWLGWDSDSGPLDFGNLETGHPPRPPLRPSPSRDKPAGEQQSAERKESGERKASVRKPNRERAPLDVLDNPRLTLDRPKDDGFDPYNTGAFNRSASWERIGRQKKR